ncbi:MAG TPA: hypothetical protein ENK06_10995, partial [Gammaproteobacteria bacterium]|nr:hypothetical protein [Gammaproteobacteria bacterium]
MFRFRIVILALTGLVLLVNLSATFAASVSAKQLQMLNGLSVAQKAQIAGIAAGKNIATPAQSLPNLTPSVTKPENLPKKNTQQNVAPVDESVLKVGSSLIVYFDPVEEVQFETKGRYSPDYPQQLFELNRRGEIEIPGIGRIPLAGLTEKEAAARIALEPLLANYKIRVLKLPVQQFGVSELKPFGYDLFKQMPEQMAPDSSMPVPGDYIVGPGDQVQVQLLGKENQDFLLQVSRDSTLSIPGIGVFSVTGLNFDELKRDIKKRINKQFIGVDAFITLGELRSIRVFVLGEVEKPGAYFVSGLATMTNALMYGEGIKPIGSLRHVELKRAGKLVGELDLYRLLMHGDTRDDARLRPGDVIHVPTIRQSVSISGEVRRPAVYELNTEKSLADVISLAGGMLPTAVRDNVKVVRVDGAEKKLLEVNYSDKSAQDFLLRSGDIIKIAPVMDREENVVSLKGEVLKPRRFQWTPTLKINQLVPNIRALKPNADSEYVLVKRYLPPAYNLKILTANLKQALSAPESKDNISLKPRDEIVVFSLDGNRSLQMAPIVEQLIAQSDSTKPSQIVRVTGMVRGPGRYPLEPGMRISDLVIAGGRLLESAYTMEAELTRFIVSTGKPRKIQLLNVNLRDALLGKQNADLLLRPYDLLNIKEIPMWEEKDHVTLVGEVLFPGEYAIRRGETLKHLLHRAGGLTKFAYPPGAVFIREDLRKREQDRLDSMAANLEAELAAISLERSGDPTKIQSAGTANQLLIKL